jgi:hypothetical protein
MLKILNFGHRVRVTSFVKELLDLPYFKSDPLQGTLSSNRLSESQHLAETWRSKYNELHRAAETDHIELVHLQAERLVVSLDDAEPDVNHGGDDALPRQPQDMAPEGSFAEQLVFKTPSAYVRHLVEQLPPEKRLTYDQILFMVRFAACCDEAWEDEKKPPAQRRVCHMLLLGAGGSGKTYVVQSLVFRAVRFIWPPRSEAEPTLMVVAASNAQAKNISTCDVKARTMHNAAAMRVQKLTNDRMRPGNKQNVLTRVWNEVRVLIIEEVSMVAAALYNMLDVRSIHGRSKLYDVSQHSYKQPHHHFGRVPIVIHLGDFLQLSPTANTSLVADVNGKNEDGTYTFREPPSLEVQHAIKVFAAIPYVFELQRTKRFKEGDPLVEFLSCMRQGLRYPRAVWAAFERTFARDREGHLDPRHGEDRFRGGYGMALYWETLSRWATRRSRRDAVEAGVPLVFLQAVDECNSIDREAAQRLLNVPNSHNTGITSQR